MIRKTAFVVLPMVLLSAAGVVFFDSRREQNAPPRRGAPHVEYLPDEENLRGRDFVRLGEFGSAEGVLKKERGEWFLIADREVCELHLGDRGHRAGTGIRLEEGKRAFVTGFIYAREDREEIDIAVCAVDLDGERYRFRADDGAPLWRGSGSGGGPGKQR